VVKLAGERVVSEKLTKRWRKCVEESGM
jgi:hypothetical protein